MSTSLQALLGSLYGEWRGEGHGRFTGLEDFRYREILSFDLVPERDEMTCTQNTFKFVGEGQEEPSHLETGLLEMKDGIITWNNIQSGGRVELLQLADDAVMTKDRLYLPFHSKGIFNDGKERPATQSQRILRLEGGTLSYRVLMATTAQPELEFHLEASLDLMPPY